MKETELEEEWIRFICPSCAKEHQINSWSFFNAGKQQTISDVLEILDEIEETKGVGYIRTVLYADLKEAITEIKKLKEEMFE